MKKLADISMFEKIQSNAHNSISDLSVFNFEQDVNEDYISEIVKQVDAMLYHANDKNINPSRHLKKLQEIADSYCKKVANDINNGEGELDEYFSFLPRRMRPLNQYLYDRYDRVRTINESLKLLNRYNGLEGFLKDECFNRSKLEPKIKQLLNNKITAHPFPKEETNQKESWAKRLGKTAGKIVGGVKSTLSDLGKGYKEGRNK